MLLSSGGGAIAPATKVLLVYLVADVENENRNEATKLYIP